MNYRDMIKQDMSRYLANLESRLSQKDFYSQLLKAQELDPENFRVGTALIPGEEFPRAVVIGGHTMLRGDRRLGLSPDKLLEMAIHDLENPFVGVEVVQHPVVIEGNEVVEFEEDGINSTVAIFEGKRYALVFEAGFNYILVKTVWDSHFGGIRTAKTNAVIRIQENRAVTRNVGEN